jgi:hypothetical protein
MTHQHSRELMWVWLCMEVSDDDDIVRDDDDSDDDAM